MRPLTGVIALGLGLCAPVASAFGDDLVVSEDRQTIKQACAGHGGVQVIANGNNVTLTGECGRIEVSGNGNTVTVEAAAAIAVLGNDNTVTWERGNGAKQQPSISNPGSRNRIAKLKKAK